jgi:hypothetical protein
VRRKPTKIGKSPKRQSQVGPANDTAFLDVFTGEQLARWTANSVAAQQCANALYFDLERQRQNHYEALVESVRQVESISLSVDSWVRVTDFRWNLEALSSAGSISGIGGRFNIGQELRVATGQSAPCLYIAEDRATAELEHFGAPLERLIGELSVQEYALRRPTSFTTFILRGRISNVFDLRNEKSIQAFVDIIKSFSLLAATQSKYRALRLPVPRLARTTKELMRLLLARPENWRQMPQLMGHPAPCQTFGWFLHEAGFEGVLYPSQRGGGRCLGIFPKNFKNSDSRIEITGDAPPGATHTCIDKDNLGLSL